MNSSEERRNGEGCGILEDILHEYKTKYAGLDEEGRYEADVQRAFKIFDSCVNSESLSADTQSLFAEWFLKYGDCAYVEEAFCRYMNRNWTAANEVPERSVTMLEEFWIKAGKENEAERM